MRRRRLTGLLVLSALALHGLYVPALHAGSGLWNDGLWSVVDAIPALPLFLPVGELPLPERLGLVLEPSAPAIVTKASRTAAPRGPPTWPLLS